MSDGDVNDLLPDHEVVEIREKKYKVYGLTFDDAIKLATNFPEIKALLDGNKIDVTAERIMVMGPAVVGTIIAMGMGFGDDPDGPSKARKFSAYAQLRLIDKIFEVSFPEGLRPFVLQLRALRSSLGISATIVTSNSENGVSDTPSTPVITGQLQMDEESKQHYTPRRANSSNGRRSPSENVSAA